MSEDRGVLSRRMAFRPEPCPKEFRDDVVRAARQGDARLLQIAADFEVGEATLHDWLTRADIDEESVRE